jgi:protein ImuB
MYGGLHSPAPLLSHDILLELACRFTPRIEAIHPALVLLDLHDLGRLWPSCDDLGRALLEAARSQEIPAQVALARHRSTALLAARAFPDLTVVPPGREAAILAPLPLSLLDLSAEQDALLRRWGLRTLGDLAALPKSAVAQRLGAEGARLFRLSRGEEETPFVPTPRLEAFAFSLELESPIDGLEPLSFLLMRLLDPLCGSLRERGRRARSLVLDLDLINGAQWRRQVKTVAATADARTWRTLLLLDLAAHPPTDAIRKIALRAEPACARLAQLSLLDPAQIAPERLAETLGRLRAWMDSGRAGSPVLLDTHRPGAFAMRSFDPRPAQRTPPRTRSMALALRAFRPPRSARVVLQNEAPAFLVASEARGVIVGRTGPWRASGDWWDEAWSREEWDVALDAGGIYRIFRDRLRDRWYLEGVLD